MCNVVSISDYKPHIIALDKVTNVVHVVPVELVSKVADGCITMDDIEQSDSVIRALLNNLLEAL